MRDVRICADVEAAIGAAQAEEIRRGPWPDSYKCARCRREEVIDGGPPVAVSIDEYDDGPVVFFAHPACRPSQTRRVAGRLPDMPETDSWCRAGVLFTPLGVAWPYLVVEPTTSWLAVPSDGDWVDAVTLELGAFCERGLAPVSSIGPTLPALPPPTLGAVTSLDSPMVALRGGPTGGGGIWLAMADGDRQPLTLMEPLPSLPQPWVPAAIANDGECAVYAASRAGLRGYSDADWLDALNGAARAGRVVGGRARVARTANLMEVSR